MKEFFFANYLIRISISGFLCLDPLPLLMTRYCFLNMFPTVVFELSISASSVCFLIPDFKLSNCRSFTFFLFPNVVNLFLTVFFQLLLSLFQVSNCYLLFSASNCRATVGLQLSFPSVSSQLYILNSRYIVSLDSNRTYGKCFKYVTSENLYTVTVLWKSGNRPFINRCLRLGWKCRRQTRGSREVGSFLDSLLGRFSWL